MCQHIVFLCLTRRSFLGMYIVPSICCAISTLSSQARQSENGKTGDDRSLIHFMSNTAVAALFFSPVLRVNSKEPNTTAKNESLKWLLRNKPTCHEVHDTLYDWREYHHVLLTCHVAFRGMCICLSKSKILLATFTGLYLFLQWKRIAYPEWLCANIHVDCVVLETVITT